MTQSSKLPLALTLGDPAGIGPELALKAWARRVEHSAAFFFLADPEALAKTAERVRINAPIAVVSPETAAATFADALPVVPLREKINAEPGMGDPANAPAILKSIERAVSLTLAGQAHAVVTNPIAKSTLYAAGFKYPGHTEYLGALSAAAGHAGEAVMMIWSEALAVVPVTIHIALAAVPAALNKSLIERTARIVDKDLRQRFGVQRPRIAVAGLNPHAGEAGAMGREDLDIIAPAIAALRAEGLDVTGPKPADTMFHAKARASYDVALCMYHDQALIPAKTLAFDTGANVTLGLPFIRTSPDHGTAFDIAARGIADPSSLIAALKLAARLQP